MTVPMPTQESIKQMDAAGISGRKIAAKTGLSRNTVAKYLNKVDFSPQPKNVTQRSLVDDYALIVEGWLSADLLMPKKQRHTGQRIFDRLVTEHGFKGSYWSVARWLKRYRQQQMLPGEGYSELSWEPGIAQADFGEAEAVIAGTRVTIHFFALTFPSSNARFVTALPGETAECVAEGLKTIFEHIGSIPHTIVFDNATGVGRKIADSKTVLAEMFAAFKLHYGFKVRFTNPNSGNEKGSVENAVGFLRRNLMVPIPYAETFSGLSKVLLQRCDNLLEAVHYRKKEPLKDLFKLDKKVMLNLPGISFDACRWVLRSVDLVGNVVLNDIKYFVGSEYAGQKIQAGLRAFNIEFLTLDKQLILIHKRQYGQTVTTVRFSEQLLPGLIRKPSSIRNSPLKEDLSKSSINYLEHGDHYTRRNFFEVLYMAANICGFLKAEQIISGIIAAGRKIDRLEIEMLALREVEAEGLDSFNTTSMGHSVDLNVYDKFSKGDQ